ncbi:MAG: response regulator transcription factor [Candidatus Eisenbacteria bacterium]
MSPVPPFPVPVPPGPRILVVDDDRRVVELLEIAFGNQGFQVLMAADGDEAIRSVAQDKPDLVVLDVRLPRRSGLDVCEMLRRDHPDFAVPIIVVSAAVETETRLQAFARGADDFLSKPFSPKELVARVRRLLARTSETREARLRVRDLERELGRAQESAQRAHSEASREQRLRRLAQGPGQALHRSLDADEIADRLLFDAQARLGSGFVALLWAAEPGEPLRPWAARGESLDRVAALEIERHGPLAELIEGLGRPVLRRELERFPELRREMSAFLAHGVTVLAPIGAESGLEALLVADERADGGEPSVAELELLASLCEIAAVAMRNGARVRQQLLLTLERVLGGGGGGDLLRDEALTLAAHAAQATLIPPRQRTLVEHALRLGATPPGSPAHETLSALLESDATGLIRDLLQIEDRAAHLQPVDESWLPEESRPALLLAVTRAYLHARRAGEERGAALDRARALAGEALDPGTAQAFSGALREGAEPARLASE